jgi:hypothetical protein
MAKCRATSKPDYALCRPEIGKPSTPSVRVNPFGDRPVHSSDCNTVASGLLCNYLRMNNLHVRGIVFREILFPLGQPFALQCSGKSVTWPAL